MSGKQQKDGKDFGGSMSVTLSNISQEIMVTLQCSVPTCVDVCTQIQQLPLDLVL